MALQCWTLRGNLVISDGKEAWMLTAIGWQAADATIAFRQSDWLKPSEARRTFGSDLPRLPSQAFAGREMTVRVLGKGGPRIARP